MCAQENALQQLEASRDLLRKDVYDAVFDVVYKEYRDTLVMGGYKEGLRYVMDYIDGEVQGLLEKWDE